MSILLLDIASDSSDAGGSAKPSQSEEWRIASADPLAMLTVQTDYARP